MMRIKLVLLTLAAALVLSACEFSLAADITPPPGAQQAAVARTQPATESGPLYPLVPPNPVNGEPIFAEKCVPCHGQTGLGDGPQAAQLPNPVTPLGAVDTARQAVPARWYTQVTQGNLEKFMPPFRSLSDRERWDVVAYALTLGLPAETAGQGAALYQDNCASCHGASGQGDGPDAAGLGAPVPNLADQALMAQRSQVDLYQAITDGAAPAMPAFADRLTEVERWLAAAYLRTLTFAGASQPSAAASQPPAAASLPGAAPITGTQESPAPAVDATPAAAALAAETGMGQVSGSVVNASGGEPPVGVEVLLRGFDDMTQVVTETTTIKENGAFTFENVDMPEGRVFLVTLEYNQATYGSDIGIVENGLTSLDLPVTVYDTTSDAGQISADRLHLFFEFVNDSTLRIIQLYILSNPSNQTVVPTAEGQPVVRFSLPEGASNLEFQEGAMGERYVETEDGFGDTAAIRPGSGSHEILFGFEMPYDRKLDLVQQMNLPVGAVVILLPEGGIKVKGDTLTDAGVRDVQGVQYHLYNGQGLAAGESLRLSLSGSSGSSAPSIVTGSTTNLVVGLGAFGVALVAAGLWLYQRSRRSEPEEDVELVESDEIEQPEVESQQALVDAIVALDDQYEAGQLPQDAYLQRRAGLKEQLRRQMQAGQD